MTLEHTAVTLQPLTRLDQIDHLFLAERPVLVLKHSPTCGISAQAYEELAAVLREQLPLGAAFLLSVSDHREVSRALAARTRIRHESPQVLLFAGGEVRWQASHFRVTADRVRSAVRQISRDVASTSEVAHSAPGGATVTMND